MAPHNSKQYKNIKQESYNTAPVNQNAKAASQSQQLYLLSYVTCRNVHDCLHTKLVSSSLRLLHRMLHLSVDLALWAQHAAVPDSLFIELQGMQKHAQLLALTISAIFSYIKGQLIPHVISSAALACSLRDTTPAFSQSRPFPILSYMACKNVHMTCI